MSFYSHTPEGSRHTGASGNSFASFQTMTGASGQHGSAASLQRPGYSGTGASTTGHAMGAGNGDTPASMRTGQYDRNNLRFIRKGTDYYSGQYHGIGPGNVELPPDERAQVSAYRACL